MANTPDQYDTLPLAADNSFAASPGFKPISTRSGWKKWISVKKLSKQENVAWQDNQSYLAGVPNKLTKSATVLRFFVANPAATTWGTLKATWYVKMRG